MLWHWLNNIGKKIVVVYGKFFSTQYWRFMKNSQHRRKISLKNILIISNQYTTRANIFLYFCSWLFTWFFCMRIPFWHGKHYFLSIYVGQGGNNGRGKCEPTAKHTKGENNSIKKTRGFQRIFNVGLHVSSVSTKALFFGFFICCINILSVYKSPVHFLRNKKVWKVGHSESCIGTVSAYFYQSKFNPEVPAHRDTHSSHKGVTLNYIIYILPNNQIDQTNSDYLLLEVLAMLALINWHLPDTQQIINKWSQYEGKFKQITPSPQVPLPINPTPTRLKKKKKILSEVEYQS